MRRVLQLGLWIVAGLTLLRLGLLSPSLVGAVLASAWLLAGGALAAALLNDIVTGPRRSASFCVLMLVGVTLACVVRWHGALMPGIYLGG